MTIGEKILNSFFQSVTLRTAGFVSVDQSALTDAGKAVSMLLMLVGGSSGSTAGGLKTVTFIVLILFLAARARGRSTVCVYKRTIPQSQVLDAMTIAGIMITASHNPKEYNGYKAYWNDGGQFVAPHDTKVIDEVLKIKSLEDIKMSGNEDNIEIIGEDIDKIYLDAYPQIATSSGQRAPECNAAITNRVELGTSIVNYIGHAGEVGWTEERILTNDDIFSWRNSPKLHLMITASCEFSRFDDHTRTSSGEYVFLNHHGGAIAMMTTARVTYASNSIELMKLLYEHLFDIEGGKFITMGDVYVYAKTGTSSFDKSEYKTVQFGSVALKIKNIPNGRIKISVDTNKKPQDRLLKEASSNGFNFENVDFENLSFETGENSYVVFRVKEKKFIDISFKVYSDELDKPFGLINITLQAFLGGYVKRS